MYINTGNVKDYVPATQPRDCVLEYHTWYIRWWSHEQSTDLSGMQNYAWLEKALLPVCDLSHLSDIHDT